MIVNVRVFRASGKWYTDETFEVPDGLGFHSIIERNREYQRERWPGWYVAIMGCTPEHEHEHPALAVPKEPEQ